MFIRQVARLATLCALFTLAGAASASAASLTVASSSSAAGEDTTITVSGSATADSTVYLTVFHDHACAATEAAEEGQSTPVAGSPAGVTAADPFTKQFTHHFDNAITSWRFCAYLYDQGASTSGAPTASGTLLVATGSKPTVQPQGAQGITFKAATISGGFQSATGSADAHLEYGTDTTYGQSVGAASGANGSVSASLTGLAASTTYHWKEVATNAYGTTESPDQTFTTAAPPDPSSLVLTAPADAKHHRDLQVAVAGTAGEQATLDAFVDPSGACGATLAAEKGHAGVIAMPGLGAAEPGAFSHTGELVYGPAAGTYVLCGYLYGQSQSDPSGPPAATASAPLTVTHSACPATDVTVAADPVQHGTQIYLQVAVPGPGTVFVKSSDQYNDADPQVPAGEFATLASAAGTYKVQGYVSHLGTVEPSFSRSVKLTYAVRFVPTFQGDPLPDTPPTAAEFSSVARGCQLPNGTVVSDDKVAGAPRTVATALDNIPPGGSSEPNVADGTLQRALTPSGKHAKLGAILKARAFVAKVTVPGPGKAAVVWYFVPKGAHISRKHKPVVIASGSRTYKQAGAAKLKIKLTKKGRALLKRSKSVKITATGSFTPKGSSTTPAKAQTFKLKR